MTKPIELDDHRRGRVKPLLIRSAAEFEGKAVPKRDWLIPSVLVRRSVSLLAGDGGVGKSLACLQLQAACALGKVDWLGIPMPDEPISSFGFYCEDDDEEIHRRLYDICKHYGASFTDLGDRLRWVSRVGEENELVTFSGRGETVKAKREKLFEQIELEVEGYKHQLVIIDTVADTFAGNENFRAQVKTFVNIMRRLTLPTNGGVLLNAHPSKSALADGSGFSGSTAWNGSVRNRLYFTRPKIRQEDEDEDGPTNERILKVMKSNYSAFGQRIKCRWQDGVFVPTDAPTVGKSQFERLDDDYKVLSGAEWLVKRGTFISASSNAPNRLSALLRAMPSCKDITARAVMAAQERLIEKGKLVQVELGPKSKRRIYLRPVHLSYPGEDDRGATDTAHPAITEDGPKQEGLL
jgi:RecA-family ATPase